MAAQALCPFYNFRIFALAKRQEILHPLGARELVGTQRFGFKFYLLLPSSVLYPLYHCGINVCEEFRCSLNLVRNHLIV